MGVATAILDATQQQCLAVWQTRDGRIEDRIDRIRPVFGTEDGIAWMTMEEDFVETILVHVGAPLVVEPRGGMEG
jgi:hypothetical protein